MIRFARVVKATITAKKAILPELDFSLLSIHLTLLGGKVHLLRSRFSLRQHYLVQVHRVDA